MKACLAGLKATVKNLAKGELPIQNQKVYLLAELRVQRNLGAFPGASTGYPIGQTDPASKQKESITLDHSTSGPFSCRYRRLLLGVLGPVRNPPITPLTKVDPADHAESEAALIHHRGIAR